jgi:phospholipid/cholesterol/gamma-HCH transport system ATP-binding protein
MRFQAHVFAIDPQSAKAVASRSTAVAKSTLSSSHGCHWLVVPDCESSSGMGSASVSAMIAPLLELRGIVMQYGDKTVLSGVDLAIERGETVVVIGGSGSGKSTLARIIMGLEPPTAGSVLLDGLDLLSLDTSALHRARGRFGMVFQGRALLDGLTVFDNVAFPLRERAHLPEAEIHERVVAQLEALGLLEAARKMPAELSGGMAKRVGIARAMVMGPEILVYDEPTSGLDPVTSRTVDGLIEDLRQRYCVTSIVITHDMATAYGIADRIVLLANGKVAAEGDPDSIFRLEDERIRPFALSSGVDPTRFAHRRERPSPAAIRRRWEARRDAPRERASWFGRLLHGT